MRLKPTKAEKTFEDRPKTRKGPNWRGLGLNKNKTK